MTSALLPLHFTLFQVDEIRGDLARDTEVDCPVDQMETEELKKYSGLEHEDMVTVNLRVIDYHNWEDDSAVFVNITAPHTEDPVRRLGRGQTGEWKLYWLGVAVAGRVGGVRTMAVAVAGQVRILKIFRMS